MNQGGSTVTVTLSGGRTALRYISGLSATFITILRTVCVPEREVIVTEGWFRLDGLSNEAAHDPPVAILSFSGSALGREHKKLRYSSYPAPSSISTRISE